MVTLPYDPKSGDKLYATQLKADLDTLANLVGNLQNQLSVLQDYGVNAGPFPLTLAFPGQPIFEETFVLEYTAAFDFSVLSADYTVGTTGGSFTFTVRNNGVNVNGLTDIQVNSANKVRSYSTDSTSFITTGSQLDIVVTNVVGQSEDCIIGLNCVKTSTSVIVPSGAQQAITSDGDDFVTSDGDTLVFAYG